MKSVLDAALAMMRSGQDSVLASIVRSEGSSPRGAGAHMLVGAEGRIAGTVGGGAVEELCIRRSQQALSGERAGVERFGLREGEKTGMICGGDGWVHFAPIRARDEASERALELALEAQLSGKDSQLLLMADGKWAIRQGERHEGAPAYEYGEGRPEAECFVQRIACRERVFIFGGGHVAQALTPVLASVGFACIIVEDRQEFCTQALFPRAQRTILAGRHEWAKAIDIGEGDYVCIMTRNHAADYEAQAFALGTRACYIGVIGSRRKVAATQERLCEAGFSQEDIARITSPIGLAIGAQTPQEIAVSIAAQLIEHRASLRLARGEQAVHTCMG